MATKIQYDDFAKRSLHNAGLTTDKDEFQNMFEGVIVEDFERVSAIVRVAKSVKRAMKKELEGRGIAIFSS